MAHIPRLYGSAALHPGPLTLAAEQAKRLTTVMRVAPGDELLLFSGGGREWRATVTATTKQSVAVEVGAIARQEAPAAVVLETWIGLIRATRFEDAIEKCVEAGADIIRPVICEFSQRGDVASTAKTERWQRIVIEATEQSGRLYLPVLQPPAPFERVLASHAGPVAYGAQHGRAITEVSVLLPTTGHLAWVVGPEGGLSPAEAAALSALGAIPISLGPYILRTETAATTGTALLRSLTKS